MVSRVTRRMYSPHIGHSLTMRASYLKRAEFRTRRWCFSKSPPHHLDNLHDGFYRGSKVFRHRRSDASRLALETLVPHERAYRRSLADEVAIDFPSSRAAIEYFRRDHVDAESPAPMAHAGITITRRQAFEGALVSLEVHVPRTCACCGGRGEVWSEHCEHCGGQGQELHTQRLTVAVPRGVTDGDRFSFKVSLARGPRTRVDVRVAVTA